MEEPDVVRLAKFLYEVGTTRLIPRMHRQVMLTSDMSDNIAAHSFRVAIIGYVLAKMTGADASTVMMMGLLHDLGEARTGDHNWIHKRYIVEHGDQVIDEQLGTLPFPDLANCMREYEVRESTEAILAKDADVLDQILLLREYAWQGNKEAPLWLAGKSEQTPYHYTKYLKTEEAKALGRAIYDEVPSDWWKPLYQNTRRED